MIPILYSECLQRFYFETFLSICTLEAVREVLICFTKTAIEMADANHNGKNNLTIIIIVS